MERKLGGILRAKGRSEWYPERDEFGLSVVYSGRESSMLRFVLRNSKEGWGCSSVVTSLLTMHKALGSIPRTTNF